MSDLSHHDGMLDHIEELQIKVNKALALFEEIIELQRCEFAKVRSIIPELKSGR